MTIPIYRKEGHRVAIVGEQEFHHLRNGAQGLAAFSISNVVDL